jgi:outer membrane immunogenic protein
MRRELAGFIVAAVSLMAAQSASAADMPAKAPVYKAPMAAATPWTGFYVNGGIGYGMWAADTNVPTTAGTCIVCVNEVQGGKGWLGTIGAGYDYQFSPRIVAGIFGDASLSELKGTIQQGRPFLAGEIKQTSSWAVGARIGLLATPKTLSYVNGGYTAARFAGADIVDTFVGAPAGFSTPATTFNGWFLGGGVETALSPGWFWRTEYRYAYYGNKTLPETDAAGTNFGNINFKPTVQTVTTQIVYKFNGGLRAPVYPAMPAKPTNWTGFYANAGTGYGLWAADTTVVDPFTGACALCVNQRQGGKGYLGVIGAGYDYQFAPAWVAGVFGDVDISSLKGTIQDQTGTGPFAIAGDIKQTSAWAIGPRLGWLPSPQTMTYVNGGYAGARFSNADMVNVTTGANTGFSTQAFNTNGWFVGGGVETTFDLFGLLGKGWFWRNEYRYASYASKTVTDTNGAGGSLNSINFKPVVQTVTSQVIFKFN